MKLTGEAKFLLGVVAVTVIIIGASFAFFSRPAPQSQPIARNTLIADDSYKIGNASASAYLVEFSDYQCPACKAFEPAVEDIVGKHADKLLFVYRDFPLEQHPFAFTSALTAAAAAKQGKFWEMHVQLFENQERFSDSLWLELARKLELNTDKFESDLKSPELKKHVEDDRNVGVNLGINATPTFFLNGIKLELASPDDLVKAVNKAIE